VLARARAGTNRGDDPLADASPSKSSETAESERSERERDGILPSLLRCLSKALLESGKKLTGRLPATLMLHYNAPRCSQPSSHADPASGLDLLGESTCRRLVLVEMIGSAIGLSSLDLRSRSLVRKEAERGERSKVYRFEREMDILLLLARPFGG